LDCGGESSGGGEKPKEGRRGWGFGFLNVIRRG